MRKLALTVVVFGLIVLLTTYSNAQRPMRGGGFGGQADVGSLIRNKSVQEEIKLTSEQKEKLEPKIKEMAEKQKELFSEFKGKFDKETGEKMQAKMKELSAPFVKFVDETLTSEQKTRIKQIRVQRLGMRAFTDEEIAKSLKLTEEQTTKIKAIAEENGKEARELRKEFKDNFAEAQKKMAALTKEGLDKAVAVLDKSQQAEFEKMTGKPFEYKADFGGFRKKDN